jgi:lipopolysaccharide export system permease protein
MRVSAIYVQNYYISMKKKIFKKLYTEIFVFFLLTLFTLGAIIWILQAVNFLDIVSEDGHSIATYFKYSSLNIAKIFNKTFLLSFFLALFYIYVVYEENNQLLIYWSNSISKIKFLNSIILFSIFLVIISLILSFQIVPYTQDKARSYIRSSNLDFFPSLIKPRKFIDTVENLTVFINKKEKDKIDKIILKDSSNSNNIQIIIAKNGQIINNEKNKFLVLNDGKIINTNLQKRSTIFDFKETTFDLSKYKTKTTTATKIQEINTVSIFYCLQDIYSKNFREFKNFKCQKDIKKELSQEFYKRIYLPFYILLITIIVSFLILNSHFETNYRSKKIKVFLIGISTVIFSEVSVNFISENNFQNFIILMMLPILIIVSYLLFINKVKISS